MNHYERHQFRSLCEASYRKENAVNQDRCAVQATDPDAPASTGGTVQPWVKMPRNALRVAVRLAEQAADEINAKLRDAEQERDNLAHRLGAQQDLVDRLKSERDYRTRHLRELEHARDDVPSKAAT